MSRLLLVMMLVGCAPAPKSVAPSSGVERLNPPRAGFYGKRLFDGQLVVAAHESVSDDAMLVARSKLDAMLEHAPLLRRNLASSGMELHVVGKLQFTSDLPEHHAMRGVQIDTGELFDDHMRGGHIVGRFASCTEGNLLGFVGDGHFGDETCVHELAHAIDALAIFDPAFRKRIEDGYRAAQQTNTWVTKHSSRSPAEYFAEATKYYFTVDGRFAFVREQLTHGRAWLRAQHPNEYALVDDLYSGRVDPGAPWNVELRDGERASADTEAREARISVWNDTGATIRVIWIQPDGTRDERRGPDGGFGIRIDAPAHETVYTFVGHSFAVVDGSGKSLGGFVADRASGRVLVGRSTTFSAKN